MSRRRNWGNALILCGLLCITAALLLLLHNRTEANNAAASASAAMDKLAVAIRENARETPLPPAMGELPPPAMGEPPRPAPVEASPPAPGTQPTPAPGQSPRPTPTAPPEPEEIPEMDTVEIEGFAYIGFLTVPSLELELPVMSEWDYERLKTAPCRFSGNLAAGDLVIAAHNFDRHFGQLMQVFPGTEIIFTDVHGVSTDFEVAELEILGPTSVDEMTAGEYPLSLFTCTYGGATRFTLRCAETKNPLEKREPMGAE